MSSEFQLMSRSQVHNNHNIKCHQKYDFPLMLQSVKGVHNCLAKCIVVEEKGRNVASCYPPDFGAWPCLLELHD
uniref:Uncharacterized protein n=1 Tax=Arundo donax TaxID=35708 RepID=A0A0A9GZ43_ARUDO